jgi:hypothetical protein
MAMDYPPKLATTHASRTDPVNHSGRQFFEVCTEMTRKSLHASWRDRQLGSRNSGNAGAQYGLPLRALFASEAMTLLARRPFEDCGRPGS